MLSTLVMGSSMFERYPGVSLHEVLAMEPAHTLILSVNNRHARRLLAEFAAVLGAERRVMAVPAVMPLPAWLAALADQLAFEDHHAMAAHRVDEAGARHVWEAVIREAEADEVFLDVGQAARLAADADRLLDEWQIEVLPHEQTPDFERFLLWRTRYRQRLAQLDAEDGNLAYEKVLAAARQGALGASRRQVVLAGFTELSPRLSALLQTVAEAGGRIVRLDAAAQPAARIRHVCAADRYAEWQVAAQWARERLDGDAHACYAIVAPQLETDAALARRVLHGCLHDSDHAWNIAVARPLSQWPLIRAALAWLTVGVCYQQGHDCPAADLGAALLSGGCAGHDDEQSGRAAIDVRMRDSGRVRLGPEVFAGYLAQWAPQLAAAWEQVMSCLHEESAARPASQWLIVIRTVLERLGFPGRSHVGSHAYQTLEAFEQLLERFGRLGPIAGNLDFAEAVSVLARLARDTSFQPQRDPHARLDVLGLLESEGGRWDAIWVLGMTDEVLPAAPQPNPLVPLAALRRVQAPRATPERELQWAQSMHAGLLACAPDLVISHPAQEGERALRPSPLLADLTAEPVQPRQAMIDPWELTCVDDDWGPPVGSDEEVHGGMALLDAQARNPLWAFARYRLGAFQLPDYAEGPDAGTRGRFLHRVLEHIWRMLQSLAALHDAIQNDRLATLVEQAVAASAQEMLGAYGPVLRELEMQRAVHTVHEWLKLDAARTPFEIASTESTVVWQRGTLALRLRLDRVDTLADGRQLIIDYKTGSATPDPRADWSRERPVDVQLLCYAAMADRDDTQVAGLVLAHVHARAAAVAGLSDGDCGFEELAHFTDWPAFAGRDWRAVLDGWTKAVHALADEFSSGYAANHYADIKDLRYCDVLPFLRLNQEDADADESTQ